jgi:hypothetical protein
MPDTPDAFIASLNLQCLRCLEVHARNPKPFLRALAQKLGQTQAQALDFLKISHDLQPAGISNTQDFLSAVDGLEGIDITTPSGQPPGISSLTRHCATLCTLYVGGINGTGYLIYPLPDLEAVAASCHNLRCIGISLTALDIRSCSPYQNLDATVLRSVQ